MTAAQYKRQRAVRQPVAKPAPAKAVALRLQRPAVVSSERTSCSLIASDERVFILGYN